jgi:Outer membrane lipoprotein-sorting protein
MISIVEGDDKMIRRFAISILLLSSASLIAVFVSASVAADELSAGEFMNVVHKTYYYAADGGKAHVKMTLTDKKDRTRVREFWMLRTDIEDMGDQNYYVYFTMPSDVRRTTVLTLKHADGDDDRWLYVPSVDLVKRIASDNKQESFVGSDFTYEDVSGRLPLLDTHEYLPGEEYQGVTMKVVKSTPLNAKTSDYAYRKTWVDPSYLLPVKEEYYSAKDKLIRVFTIDKIEEIEGIPTAVTRTMKNIKKKHATTIEFRDVTFKVELKPSDYNERLLKNPPRSLR